MNILKITVVATLLAAIHSLPVLATTGSLTQRECIEYVTAYSTFMRHNDAWQLGGQLLSLFGIAIQGVGASVAFQAESRAHNVIAAQLYSLGVGTTVAGNQVTFHFADKRTARRAIAQAIFDHCKANGHI